MPTPPRFHCASLTVRDGIAEFVHERPQARNPLSQELRQDYITLLDHVQGDPAIRVLVLRGSGGSFSAGGDVREMQARIAAPAPDAVGATRRRMESANQWLQRLLHLDALVIAAVDGPAYGGGFSLALHADFVLASPAARFCMSFARIGAVPDFGAHWLLPRIVGLAAARELLLTGRSIDATQARRLGLVRAIHPAEQLAERARQLAQRLCEGPAEALAMSRQMLHRSHHVDYATLGSLEAQAQAVAMASPYHHEAVRRFGAREPVRYDFDRDPQETGLDASL